ncbi:site-specific integrase [Vibrio sp. SCSIO 43137]|uniref:site-specific integrase n=1 Tax=Vibrio sp. SCSIO 43137 TaxID=3021011 RepID=UPI0023071614|nr:site-specific integrase [Vibrio sp. SCSIO 43137]WCE30067.1 site-specific integrase [Vibrio sp. SCSIO 43137]
MAYEYHKLGDGLAIYKQKASKNYYVYLNVKGGDFRKSLKTSDLPEATKKAWGYYFSYEQNIDPTIFQPSTKDLIKTLCKDLSAFFEDKHAATGKKSSKYHDHARILSDEISPLLGHLKIKQLELKHIDEVLTKAKSRTQLNVRRGAFKQLFSYAQRQSLICSYELPEIPSDVEVNRQEARRAFKPSHLAVLFEDYEQFILKPSKQISKRYRELMYYGMKFMLETGIRTGEELFNLKFSDLMKDRSKTQVFYHIAVTAGKVHSTSITSQRRVPLSSEATSIILTIANKYYLKNEVSSLKRIKLDSYIFRDPVDHEKTFDDKTFKQLCVFKKIDATKEFYTLYSCRHTYITRKLREGVNIHLLARNCGTSVEMIQKYYDDMETIDRSDELI